MAESLQPTVSARLAHVILAVVQAMGGDPAAVAAEAGFEPAAAKSADARIPLDLEERLWELAAKHVGDPLFGLHAGARYTAGPFDVFDYVCRAAANVRGALERVIRYNRLLHDVAEFSLEEKGDRAIVRHRFRAGLPGPAPQAADFTLAAGLAALRNWSGMPIAARRIEVPHAAPGDPSEFERFFGTKQVVFGAPNGIIEIDRSHLELPLPAADPGLCAVLERHADALLDALPQVAPFEGRVREILAAELRGGTPTAEAVAARLHMSTRTLHRRLAEIGTSFGEELEALRRGLAVRYLEDRRVSIAEVAFLLGYSEPRAFHRAFKAWMGETPGTWRERH
ncbi:AraC family transcriptional regulator [Vulgatibacter sp.]|uniref:AraC family transcriptional regulator n=1 Tax=Vulgatibacter sp. TaxID=1971226 RepID=UPI0035671078